jgi:mannosyltransferase OCH1-like enzyme
MVRTARFDTGVQHKPGTRHWLRSAADGARSALAPLIGRVRAAPPDEGALGIPRTLHQYWDRDPPADVERLMDKTARMNPRFAYRRWDHDTARQLLAELGRPDLLTAYRAARHPAIRADIFRLAVLLREGGVYLDADDRCIAPIDALVPTGVRAAFYQENTGSIGNNFLASTAGHELIGEALDRAVDAALDGAGESPWLATGPGLLTRVVAATLARQPGLRPPADLRIFPLRVFRASVQACNSASYKRSTRHWSRAA